MPTTFYSSISSSCSLCFGLYCGCSCSLLLLSFRKSEVRADFKSSCKALSAEEFGIGNPIKRQDVLVILDRIVSNETNLEAYVVDEDVFFEDTDDIDTYAVAAVYRMLKAKIASGKDNGRLYPQDGTTRAEAAQIIYNLLKK